MTPTILDFLDLFAEFASASYRGWRSILAALFGLVPEDPALVLRVTGRTKLPTKRAWESFWAVGRGAGKSRIAALLATYYATAITYRRVAGEQIYVIVMAPDRRQARITRRYVEGLLESVPELKALIERNNRTGAIELSTGVVIEVVTADYRLVRGRSVALAIVEEGAFLPTENSATPDSELLNALRPALARVPGSLLLFISSAYARRGELYRAWREHFGKDDDETLVVQADTLTLNPTFDKRAIDRAYEDDPAVAAAEYGAQFRSDVETFISREAVDACVLLGRRELPRVTDCRYRAFLDFAGGSGGDSATLAIAHTERRNGIDVEVLDAVREARPPFSPETVCGDFATVIRSYGVGAATSDRWGGQFPIEQMSKLGVHVEPCAKPKSDLYRELLPLINSARVELLDDARLVAQLAGLERRTARGGRDSIDHAPNGHDDVANAVAGALAGGATATEFRIRSLADADMLARLGFQRLN
jgi:hypothetical protein